MINELLLTAFLQREPEIDMKVYYQQKHEARTEEMIAKKIKKRSDNAETVELAFWFITQPNREGFRSECYWDNGGYSQGYGHACISSYVTKEQSKQIVINAFKKLDRKIQIEGLNTNQRAALISFAYNTPRNQPVYNNKVFREAVANRDRQTMKKVMDDYAWLGGLRKRRDAELELFFKS